MKIIVLGGDGFCGWPTALRFASSGHDVHIIDNLSRRKIDLDMGSQSLTSIASIQDRIAVANKEIGNVSFSNVDIANNPQLLRNEIADFGPDTIVHFAEQRAAPYSMLGDTERRYTVDNNIVGTHNLCSAIVEVDKSIHLIHLGTMGVYGYSKDFGGIPEGYLNVKINETNVDTDILYPANPGSVYHMTKCLDQLIFQFYNKNWKLKITDLHQGIVWGVDTAETSQNESLRNRFDYDGIYGTVLNRFVSQAASGNDLTIYGTGGQTRAFINVNDTANCIKLAAENNDFSPDRVRIFNQISEVKRVRDLAEMIAKSLKAKIKYVDNPRKELAENDLEVSNMGLKALGFEPILLRNALINDILYLARNSKHKIDTGLILNSPKW